MSNESKPGKDRVVCYVVFPWEVEEYATPNRVFEVLVHLYHRGYTPVVSPVYLKSTSFYTYDLQITYSLIKKADVMALCHEEKMTPTMLRELMKGREHGKSVIRVILKGDNNG